VDGFHGGEVTYARLLLRLSKKHPTLANNLKLEQLNQWVNQYKGHAQIPFEPEKLKYKEVDFLQIGCKK
jgi:hypothetical protein